MGWIGSAETCSSPLTEPVSKFKSSLPPSPTDSRRTSQSAFPPSRSTCHFIGFNRRRRPSVCPPRRKLPPPSLPPSLSLPLLSLLRHKEAAIDNNLSVSLSFGSNLSSLFGRGKIRTRFCAPQSASSVLCMYRDTGDAGASVLPSIRLSR